MKKKIHLLIFTFILLTGIDGCKKEKKDNTPPAEFPTNNISGTVVLPTGSTVNVNTLTVLSPFAETVVSSGSYTTETYSKEFSTQLVSNANDDVVMMGYSYPGLTDHTINARSTALAMVMNTPAALFLTEQGKQQMISNVLASPKLNDLVVAIENTVQANTALFDTANTDIIIALDALFANASFKTEQTHAVPVNMSHAGRNFIFSNKPLAHGSVVGIYKGGQRVQKIVVEGLQFFPTTINEAVNGYGGISGNPVEHSYTLQGDGDFDIKIRTGRPGAADGSAECSEARMENLVQFSYSMMTALLPSLTEDPSCKSAICLLIANMISGQQSFVNSQPAGVAGLSVLLLSLTNFVFSNEQTMITACPPPPKAVNFLGKIGKFFGTVAKKLEVVGNVANAANMTMFAAQWYFTTPAFDTCFRAQGTSVSTCSEPAALVYVSGNNQSGAANQALTNPLKVRVNDANSNAMPGIQVTFSVAAGGGSLSSGVVTTNANGEAQTSWTLGASGTQQVTAVAKNSQQNNITGSPYTFSASIASTEPSALVYVSGNNQTGTANQALTNPLKVRVNDANSNAMPGIQVTFSVAAGGGSLSSGVVTTNTNGEAQTSWTLGASGTQQVTAVAKNSQQNDLTGSPYTFSASMDTATVTDIDGNVYNTVDIGTQTWMKENLKTAHYRDGSAITEIESETDWALIWDSVYTTPAWCYYAGDIANNDTYGKLYNWFAVTDSRNVCPTGWHVPTDAEFGVLINYLGGNAVASGKMKALTLWNTPNDADNSSGFSALPAGVHENHGTYINLGIGCYFWSSTESATTIMYPPPRTNIVVHFAEGHDLYYNTTFINDSPNQKTMGYSVRCVKD